MQKYKRAVTNRTEKGLLQSRTFFQYSIEMCSLLNSMLESHTPALYYFSKCVYSEKDEIQRNKWLLMIGTPNWIHMLVEGYRM